MTPAASLPGTRLPIVEKLFFERGRTDEQRASWPEALDATLLEAAALIEELVGALEAICACYPKNSNAYRIANTALAKVRQ